MIIKDDKRGTSTLSLLIERHQNREQQTQQQQQHRPSPIKIPRLDLSLLSSSTGIEGVLWNSPTASSSSKSRGSASWEAIVTDRNARQAFLSLNSALSPRHPPSPSTRIFDLTQPRVPVPPAAAASSEDSSSPLVKGSARRLIAQQQQRTPRCFPIDVEGDGCGPSGSIAHMHNEMAQRLLHVIMTPGVLSAELKKSIGTSGLENGGEDALPMTDVNRLAKRMFPSLHPAISCASVAPVMCGIVGDTVRAEEVAALLLAMVYSSFVADVMGKAEIVTKETLLQCIQRLDIAQSANPEACDGVAASAVADSPGSYSSELFCLWFVKLHMAIMLKSIARNESASPTRSSASPKRYRQEVLHMLRLHSNSAIEQLRAVNASISGCRDEQQQRQRHMHSGRSAGRLAQSDAASKISTTDSRHGTPFPPNRAAASPRVPSRPGTSPNRPATTGVGSSERDTAESQRRAVVTSARTCMSAHMHLLRLCGMQSSSCTETCA
jgi:hypothetical protein